MRFRQIHLDFHTSEHITGIGRAFSRQQFQDMLMRGRVDSVTVFSKCHHGWSYHPTAIGRRHPHLAIDLLGEQIAAAHAVGVVTPDDLLDLGDEQVEVGGVQAQLVETRAVVGARHGTSPLGWPKRLR